MKVLAQKGRISLVEYDNLYAVEYEARNERRNLGCSNNISIAVNLFNEKLKTVRKDALSFGLEVYARKFA